MSSAQGWVAHYNAQGIDGLDERPRPGRPCFLDEEAIERLRARLDAGPTPEDGTCTLRGPEIRALLAREFGANYRSQGLRILNS